LKGKVDSLTSKGDWVTETDDGKEPRFGFGGNSKNQKPQNKNCEQQWKQTFFLCLKYINLEKKYLNYFHSKKLWFV